MNAKTPLIGLAKEELKAALASLDLKPYRADQLFNWIYARGATDFDIMTNISKETRATLAEHFSLKRPDIVEDQTSIDTTRKWLLGMHDGHKIETVFIPDLGKDRGSLCISSQIGCTLACTFCHTGTMKLVRNLTPEEIIGQVLLARDKLGEWHKDHQDRIFTNIVLMGMGEPLFNYDNVAKALRIITDSDGIAISRKRITLSTSGVVPMIDKVGEELDVNLAISLHAVTDELRNELVPLNKKYPIAELLEACKRYPGATSSRRITFEYVMLDGVNDSDADARKLIKLLEPIHAKVNLIPFNPWPGSTHICSPPPRITAFAKLLNKAGYISPIRTPRGQDILAACGQLKSDSERKKGQKVAL